MGLQFCRNPARFVAYKQDNPAQKSIAVLFGHPENKYWQRFPFDSSLNFGQNKGNCINLIHAHIMQITGIFPHNSWGNKAIMCDNTGMCDNTRRIQLLELEWDANIQFKLGLTHDTPGSLCSSRSCGISCTFCQSRRKPTDQTNNDGEFIYKRPEIYKIEEVEKCQEIEIKRADLTYLHWRHRTYCDLSLPTTRTIMKITLWFMVT